MAHSSETPTPEAAAALHPTDAAGPSWRGRLGRPAVPRQAPGAFASLCVGHFLSYAGNQALTPVLAVYLVAQGHDTAFVGIMLAAFSITSLLVRPVAGMLADSHAKPRVYAAAAATMGLASLGYLLTPVVALFASRIVQGGSWALVNTMGPLMAVELAADSERGRAIGRLNMVRSAAILIAPAGALFLMGAVGFPAVAIATTATGLVAALLVMRVPIRPPVPRVGADADKRGSLILRGALLPAAYQGLMYLSAPLLFAFVPLYAQDLGVADVGFVYVAAGLTMIAVQPLGRLSDRWGRLPSVAVGLAVASTGLIAFALSHDLAGLVLAGVLWATGSALVEPATTAMAIDRAPPGRRGAAIATYTSAFQVGNAVGATLWGAVIASSGFVAAYALSAALMIIGLGATLIPSLHAALTRDTEAGDRS